MDVLDQKTKEHAHQQRAAELLDAGRAAALAIAKVARPHTGEVFLGSGFPPEVVRAFAAAAGSESFIQISRADLGRDVRAIEWAMTNVAGVTVRLQSSRPVTADDVQRLNAQRARTGEGVSL